MDDIFYLEDTEANIDFSECSENIDVNREDSQEQENVKHTKLLSDFIEMYETLPEICNPTIPRYIKKDKRNLALDKLLNILKKIKSSANRADVRRKINTLRSNYRKELNKIIDSKRSGKEANEIYKPTSWVFYSLQFLDKFEKSFNQQTNKTSETNDLQGEVHGVQPPASVSPSTVSHSQSSLLSLLPPLPLKKRRIEKNDLLKKAREYLDNSNSGRNNIPPIALAWGEALTTIDSRQRMFAEKAINDIIFEARQGNLRRNSVKINEEPWPVSPTSWSMKGGSGC